MGAEKKPEGASPDRTELSIAPGGQSEPRVSPPGERTYYIRQPGGTIRQAPDRGAAVKFFLQPGAEVTRVKQEGNWYAIVSRDGRQGWGHWSIFSANLSGRVRIKRTDAGEISLPSESEAVLTAIAYKQLDTEHTEIKIGLNQPHPLKIYNMDGERPRIVCDFPNSRLSPEIRPPLSPELDMLKKIRVGIHRQPQPKLRVVVDLAGGSDYYVKVYFDELTNSYILNIKVLYVNVTQ